MRTLFRTRNIVALAAIAAVVAVAGIAWAYWSTTGTGTASASTATIDPPTGVTATATPGSGTVPVSWIASAVSSGHVAPTGYYVTRDNGTTVAAACGTSATSLNTGSSCSDSSVPDGTYHYVVTAVYHSWTAVSAPSGSVTVNNTRPSVTINQASGQADPTNATPINFTVVFSEPVGDFATGDVTVSGTGGTATVTGTGTTYNVSVSGLSTGIVTATIAVNVAHDAAGAGNTASTSTDNAVTYDVTVPTAPAPVVTAAVSSGSFINHESVTLSDVATDADAGVKSVSYYYCAGSAGCTASGTLLGTSTTSAGNYPLITSAWLLALDGPYSIAAVATDNADNVSAASAATVIRVDATPPTVSRPTVNGHS
jgi:hypothetical protein